MTMATTNLTITMQKHSPQRKKRTRLISMVHHSILNTILRRSVQWFSHVLEIEFIWNNDCAMNMLSFFRVFEKDDRPVKHFTRRSMRWIDNICICIYVFSPFSNRTQKYPDRLSFNLDEVIASHWIHSSEFQNTILFLFICYLVESDEPIEKHSLSSDGCSNQ